MGHSYCVHYSNIFMAEWEFKAVTTFHLKPLAWFRFIDDIFTIWSFSIETFMSFFNHLNNTSIHIKLTFELSHESLNFLDVTVFKGPRFAVKNILDTKVYFKPTDKHQLLSLIHI